MFSAGRATGVQVRHDHGSRYMIETFQMELRFLGMMSSPAFLRAPESNGVAERFIRTSRSSYCGGARFRPSRISAAPSVIGCDSIMSSGSASGLGFAPRLRCGETS